MWKLLCAISDFRREVSENWALFGFLNPEDGTDKLSRNVGKKLPLLAA
jgi:hypothetical protein